MEKKLHVELKENSYDIFIEKGILSRLGEKIKSIYNGNKIFVITDKNVNKHYGDKLKDSLEKAGFDTKFMVLEPGEATKSFDTLPSIYNELLDFKITRKDIIITFGGGVVGDLGGFAASSYLRGVPFIQVPTSILAQVDSSVGGKVAVDLKRGKNLVGSFYQPKAVYIDSEVLNTLSDKFYRDGMAEVIKYGCIKDKEFFYMLKNLKNRAQVMDNIEDIIYNCCLIKKRVVEIDEKDLGERMLLNFGHTLGHAVEKYYDFTGYSHGEAVAIGMYNISLKSESLGLTKQGVSEEIKEILINYGLPYELEIEKNDSILDTITLDKKNLGKILKVILVTQIGKSIIYDTRPEFFKEMK